VWEFPHLLQFGPLALLFLATTCWYGGGEGKFPHLCMAVTTCVHLQLGVEIVMSEDQKLVDEYLAWNPSQIIFICNTTEEVSFLERHALHRALKRFGGSMQPLGTGRYLLSDGRELIFTAVSVDVNRVLQQAPKNALIAVFYNREQVDPWNQERIEQQIEMLEQRREAMVIRSERALEELRQMAEADFVVDTIPRLPAPPFGDLENGE
jgi:hypothetical protein